MTMRQCAPPGARLEVAVLIPGSDEALVLPAAEMQALTAGPISELVEPGSVNRGSLTYRMKEDYVTAQGETVPMALVGDIQEMALVVPAEKVTAAYDMRPADLERSTRFKLNFDGYRKVLNLKLSGIPFWRFYLNSAFLVMMNTIGHLISCVLSFARLAPARICSSWYCGDVVPCDHPPCRLHHLPRPGALPRWHSGALLLRNLLDFRAAPVLHDYP
jgi:hypothetical protein